MPIVPTAHSGGSVYLAWILAYGFVASCPPNRARLNDADPEGRLMVQLLEFRRVLFPPPFMHEVRGLVFGEISFASALTALKDLLPGTLLKWQPWVFFGHLI